jgi:uncharacterized protein DUF6230
VKDAQGAPAYGRTNWRRFALAAVIPTAAAVGMLAGVAQGAIPATFVISGTPFKLSATRLEGDNFTQYSGAVQTAGTPDTPDHQKVLAVSAIEDASIYTLCQSVKAGPIILRIDAGDDDTAAKAHKLLIGMTELGGEAEFDNIDIGMDAANLKLNTLDAGGTPGTFGQQATHVTILDLHQTAYSTSAEKFTLPGMKLKMSFNSGTECF